MASMRVPVPFFVLILRQETGFSISSGTADTYNIPDITVQVITDSHKYRQCNGFSPGHFRNRTCTQPGLLCQFTFVHALVDQQFPKIVIRNNHCIILIHSFSKNSRSITDELYQITCAFSILFFDFSQNQTVITNYLSFRKSRCSLHILCEQCLGILTVHE